MLKQVAMYVHVLYVETVCSFLFSAPMHIRMFGVYANASIWGSMRPQADDCQCHWQRWTWRLLHYLSCTQCAFVSIGSMTFHCVIIPAWMQPNTKPNYTFTFAFGLGTCFCYVAEYNWICPGWECVCMTRLENHLNGIAFSIQTVSSGLHWRQTTVLAMAKHEPSRTYGLHGTTSWFWGCDADYVFFWPRLLTRFHKCSNIILVGAFAPYI